MEFMWTARRFKDGKVIEKKYSESKEERDAFAERSHEWKKRGKICRINLDKHLRIQAGILGYLYPR